MNYDYYVHSEMAKEKLKKLQELANRPSHISSKKAKESKTNTITNIFKWIVH